jgi:hypothetical protein
MRELHEELGVRVTAIGESLHALNDAGSPFVIEFVPTSIEGDPICLEHTALKWATLAEMQQMSLAPSDKRFVELLAGPSAPGSQ